MVPHKCKDWTLLVFQLIISVKINKNAYVAISIVWRMPWWTSTLAQNDVPV